jgi:hypothetical protein
LVTLERDRSGGAERCLLDGRLDWVQHCCMPLWGKQKQKLPPARWFIDPTDPKRWRWWDGRGWTDKYAPVEPTGTEPALRSTAPPSQPSETSRGVEVGDAHPARGVDVDDEDPSDILRRVQAGMSAARLSVPLDEQIEIVGEQFYPKEIRKLFRECGMPITAAGCTLESQVCFLVPEPWNPHDPNAVAVMVRTFHVGHLPAALARRYHGRLTSYAQRRQLVTGNARIWGQLESGGMVRARVTVVVPEAAVL